MYIYPDRPPLWRERRGGRGVFRLILDCGHDGGLITQGKRALRRKCTDCGGTRMVVGYKGKETPGV